MLAFLFLSPIHLSSLWSWLFPLHAPALIPPSLSRQGAALVHLDFLPAHHLVLWTDGSVPLPLAKAALASLSTHFVALRSPFSFWPAQFVQVSLLKPVLFCKLSNGLGSTKKSAISLFFSSSRTLALSSKLCSPLCLSFDLIPSDTAGRNFLLVPPLLSSYNGSPDNYFCRATTQLMSWPGEVRYSCPLQFLAISLHSPLVSTLFSSRTGGISSHLKSSTHRSPWFPLRNLCSSFTLALSSLVFAATKTVFYCTHIFLQSTKSRILLAAPAVIPPRTLLISFGILQLRTLCTARSFATLPLSTTSGPSPG